MAGRSMAIIHIYRAPWEHSPTGARSGSLTGEVLMGTAQAVLPHPAAALLSGHRQVTPPLHLWGWVLVCFALLFPSVPLGFGIFCRENLFLPPQHRSPHKGGPWHTWSSVGLLCSCSKSKTSASSQLTFPALWFQSSRTPPYFHQPCVSWLQILLHPPGAGNSLDQISPDLVDARREMLPPSHRAPRTLPWPQRSIL